MKNKSLETIRRRLHAEERKLEAGRRNRYHAAMREFNDALRAQG